MNKRDMKKLLEATKEARFLIKRGIYGTEREAVVKALNTQFGKASAAHTEDVLKALKASAPLDPEDQILRDEEGRT